MARIKLAYIGGGSTRGAGTMASLIHNNGPEFDGSEVVLVDLDAERLALIRTLAEKMARARGVDLTVTATTDRRAALQDCDAVLSSFRPGGFSARERSQLFVENARRIYRIGEFYGNADETLAQDGFAPNRKPRSQSVAMRVAA